MTDPIHEQISAFSDGELPAAESELLLKRLQRDEGLRARVGRYALIGEALRGAHSDAVPSGVLPNNFATRVSLALDKEIPAPHLRPAHWLKPVAGGAIAAGVAAVALVSFRVTPVEDQLSVQSGVQLEQRANPMSGAIAETSPATLPSDTVPAINANYTAPPIKVINSGRLANFVMAHSEYSSPLGRRNVLTSLVSEEPVLESLEVDAGAMRTEMRTEKGSERSPQPTEVESTSSSSTSR